MKLSPKAVAVEIWRSTLAWATIIAASIALVLAVPVLQTPIAFGVMAIAVLLVTVEVIWIGPAGIRRFRYDVARDGVQTSGGVVFTRTSFLPMQQILVVERRQGPIMRRYGLVKARLRVPGSYVDIDGITDEAFAHLQDEVRSAHEHDAHG